MNIETARSSVPFFLSILLLFPAFSAMVMMKEKETF